ncbi:unnamed protein product, partial [Symbiodinium sp. CCMP2456]
MLKAAWTMRCYLVRLSLLYLSCCAGGGVSNVQFTDTNTGEYSLAGTVSWDPPADVSLVGSYTVWLAHDNSQDNYALIEFLASKVVVNSLLPDPNRFYVPVGINQVSLSAANADRSLQFGYKAQWVIVLTNRPAAWLKLQYTEKHAAVSRSLAEMETRVKVSDLTEEFEETRKEKRESDEGQEREFLQRPPSKKLVLQIASVALYDTSSRTLGGDIAVASVQFTDDDFHENSIGGTVSWQRGAATTDFGFVSEFQLYLAEDALGTNERMIGSVGASQSSYEITNGTAATERFLFVYAANPNGRATQGTFTGFPDWWVTLGIAVPEKLTKIDVWDGDT